jgi:hypothetical protein
MHSLMERLLAALLFLAASSAGGDGQPMAQETLVEPFDIDSVDVTEARNRYPSLTLIGETSPGDILQTTGGKLVIKLTGNSQYTTFAVSVTGKFTDVALVEKLEVNLKVGIPGGVVASDHAIGIWFGVRKIVFRPGVNGGQIFCDGCPTSVLADPVHMGFTPAAGYTHKMVVRVNFAGVSDPEVQIQLVDGQNLQNVFEHNFTDATLSLSSPPFFVGPALVTQSGPGAEMWCDELRIDAFRPQTGSGVLTTGIGGTTTSFPTTSVPSSGSLTTGPAVGSTTGPASATTTGTPATTETTGRNSVAATSGTSTGSVPAATTLASPPGSSVTDTVATATSDSSDGGSALLLIVVVVTAVILVIIIAICVAVAVVRRRRLSSRSAVSSDLLSTARESVSRDESGDDEPRITEPHYAKTPNVTPRSGGSSPYSKTPSTREPDYAKTPDLEAVESERRESDYAKTPDMEAIEIEMQRGKDGEYSKTPA